jgi:hypothetical protein
LDRHGDKLVAVLGLACLLAGAFAALAEPVLM